MRKLLWTLYWRVTGRIGYTIFLKDYYDPETFTLKKKNSHIAIFKIMSKEDANGHRRVEQVFRIQIRKI